MDECLNENSSSSHLRGVDEELEQSRGFGSLQNKVKLLHLVSRQTHGCRISPEALEALDAIPQWHSAIEQLKKYPEVVNRFKSKLHYECPRGSKKRSIKLRGAPLWNKGDPVAIDSLEASRMLGELSSKYLTTKYMYLLTFCRRIWQATIATQECAYWVQKATPSNRFSIPDIYPWRDFYSTSSYTMWDLIKQGNSCSSHTCN